MQTGTGSGHEPTAATPGVLSEQEIIHAEIERRIGGIRLRGWERGGADRPGARPQIDEVEGAPVLRRAA